MVDVELLAGCNKVVVGMSLSLCLERLLLLLSLALERRIGTSERNAEVICATGVVDMGRVSVAHAEVPLVQRCL